jgi:hypothetical protein
MKDCNNSTVLRSIGYDHKKIKLDRQSPKLKVKKFTKMTPLIYFIVNIRVSFTNNDTIKTHV